MQNLANTHKATRDASRVATCDATRNATRSAFSAANQLIDDCICIEGFKLFSPFL